MEKLNSNLEKTPSDSIFARLQSFKSHFTLLKDRLGDLPDKWDGENARKFDNMIFSRIYGFLEGLMVDLWLMRIHLPPPQILPNTDGRRDLNWETDEIDLLINFPTYHLSSITLYGNSGKNNEIELTIPLINLNRIILPWITSILIHGR